MRPRRSGTRIARAVLLISFIILLGRFTYSTISAIAYHQDKQQQRIEQSFTISDVLINKKE
ncbi:YfgG family protein [Brenneria izadpanahii]